MDKFQPDNRTVYETIIFSSRNNRTDESNLLRKSIVDSSK